MNYIAFLYKDIDIGHDDKDDGYNVVIPDVEGAYTYHTLMTYHILHHKD